MKDIRAHKCDNCQEIYRSTFGMIYRDRDAYPVYHATLYARHPDRRADLAIAVAYDWSEAAELASRTSVALHVRPIDGGLADESGVRILVNGPTASVTLSNDGLLPPGSNQHDRSVR